MPTTIDATHIFDGLNEFPTHVTHIRLGSFVMNATPWPLAPIVPQLGHSERAPDSTLFQIALQWLREDRKDRQELEKAGRKTRGARLGQVRNRYYHLGVY
jgi:CCR4-NOT complex subunit CAF16